MTERPIVRYPDPALQILDQAFARFRINTAGVERLATGFRWRRGRCGSATRAACLERHPQQPDHALGRGDGRRLRLPPAVQQRQRQHAATARAGSSPASTTRAV